MQYYQYFSRHCYNISVLKPPSGIASKPKIQPPVTQAQQNAANARLEKRRAQQREDKRAAAENVVFLVTPSHSIFFAHFLFFERKRHPKAAPGLPIVLTTSRSSLERASCRNLLQAGVVCSHLVLFHGCLISHEKNAVCIDLVGTQVRLTVTNMHCTDMNALRELQVRFATCKQVFLIGPTQVFFLFATRELGLLDVAQWTTFFHILHVS